MKSALKNLPAPLRLLIRPWFAVSIVLHGILIYIPIPKAPEPIEQVSITELPSPAAIPPLPTPSVTLTPVASPSPLPAPKPTSAPPVVRPTPRLSISTPRSTPVATPAPTPVPQPTPPPTPPAGSEALPSATPSPSPTPPPAATPTPTLTPTPTSEVPLIEGAIAGCLGSDQCWETADTQWRSIAGNLRQTLIAEGYELEEIPLANDTGRRVYRLIKPDEPPRYLNLISTEQGTRYIFTDEQMTPEAMDQAAGL